MGSAISGEAAIMTAVSMICAQLPVEITDFTPASYSVAVGRWYPSRMNPGPIQALKKRGQLGWRQTHYAVLDLRPAKLATLQALDQKTYAGSIPDSKFILSARFERNT